MFVAVGNPHWGEFGQHTAVFLQDLPVGAVVFGSAAKTEQQNIADKTIIIRIFILFFFVFISYLWKAGRRVKTDSIA
jgi:hypothetical protein